MLNSESTFKFHPYGSSIVCSWLHIVRLQLRFAHLRWYSWTDGTFISPSLSLQQCVDVRADCKCLDQWSNNELNKMSLNLNMVETSAISTLYSPINTWDFPMSIDLSLPLSIDCHSIRYICDSLIEIYSVDIRIK